MDRCSPPQERKESTPERLYRAPSNLMLDLPPPNAAAPTTSCNPCARRPGLSATCARRLARGLCRVTGGVTGGDSSNGVWSDGGSMDSGGDREQESRAGSNRVEKRRGPRSMWRDWSSKWLMVFWSVHVLKMIYKLIKPNLGIQCVNLSICIMMKPNSGSP
jgi:hypothetical protein